MTVILQLFVLTILLFIAQEVFRRAGKWALWVIFFLIPLILTPFWFSVNEFDIFLWIKIYTVCFCVGWGTLMRFTSLGQKPWALGTIPLLLAANILEATVVDALGHGPAHMLNAITGVLLIARVPYGSTSVAIETTHRCRDLHLGLSRSWILGYTLWNWTFVAINYPVLAGHHIAVLGSMLIVAALDSRRWIQGRAFTLGLSLIATVTFYRSVFSTFNTSSWFDERIALVAAITALAFVATVSVRDYLFVVHAVRARAMQPS